jgi:predicted CoA-binding protein
MDLIREILEKSKNIAVIGLKDSASEHAYKVPFYMKQHGYKIYPVNPKLEGKKILGAKSYDKVTAIRDRIDIVNIFRRPEFLTGHAKEILEMNPLPKYVWFQLGIYNDEAEKMLDEKGIKVVQNRCIMVEHTKIFTKKTE